MLVFRREENGRTLKEKPSEQSENQNQTAHIWQRARIEPGSHWREASALTTGPTLLPKLIKGVFLSMKRVRFFQW